MKRSVMITEWRKIAAVLIVCFLEVTADANLTNAHIHSQRAGLVKKYLKMYNTTVNEMHSSTSIHSMRNNQMKKHLIHLKEGNVKLIDGQHKNEGNVEIYHFGRWGSVCDDEFDEREADVVCKQLGFLRARKHTHSSYFGPARKKYWMDNLYCTGNEKKLSDCRFDGWGSSDCTPSEAAGVVCEDPDVQKHFLQMQATAGFIQVYNKKNAAISRIQDLYQGRMYVRLAGGRGPSEGRVEIRHSESDWGVICGDGWSLLEASVVCRQLGFGYAQDAIQTDFFGGNQSAMVLSGVRCRGNEAALEHCLYDQSYRVQCPGFRDNIASVVCTPAMADLVIDHLEIQRTAHLEDRQLYFLQCAMEENCLASVAYQLQRENSYNWHMETRRLLRFTARIHNFGTADFRPAIPKHLWQFHQCHMHYHSMEVFATFDVLDRYGRKVAEGHKASFCLEDNQCMPGVRPFYACANFGDQGISVNCSDIYRYNIDCQWVDITELKPGFYTFKVSINPEFKVPEMTFDNNAAVCNMYYTESSITVNDCSIQRP